MDRERPTGREPRSGPRGVRQRPEVTSGHGDPEPGCLADQGSGDRIEDEDGPAHARTAQLECLVDRRDTEPVRARTLERERDRDGAMTVRVRLDHGPDGDAFNSASNVELKPVKLSNTLAFMFETRFRQRVTKYAAELEALQHDYVDCWSGLKKDFNPGKREA